MRRGINKQVQAKEAAEQEEKGTAKVNVAAGPTEDEVRTLIADAIEENGSGRVPSVFQRPSNEPSAEGEGVPPPRLPVPRYGIC